MHPAALADDPSSSSPPPAPSFLLPYLPCLRFSQAFFFILALPLILGDEFRGHYSAELDTVTIERIKKILGEKDANVQLGIVLFCREAIISLLISI